MKKDISKDEQAMADSKFSVGYKLTITLKHEAELSKINYKNNGLPINTHMSLILSPGEYQGEVREVNKTDYGFYCVVRIELIKGLSIDVTLHEMEIEMYGKPTPNP
jgi:hypothetical protein